MAVVPQNIVEQFYAWAIQQWEANAALLALLARPDPLNGLGGLYREQIPPGSTAAARAALYPAVVIQHEVSSYRYALTGQGGAPIGWEWVGTYYTVAPGAMYAGLETIVDLAGASLEAVNRSSDPLVSWVRIEEGLARGQDDGTGHPYRWMGNRLRAAGEYV